MPEYADVAGVAWEHRLRDHTGQLSTDQASNKSCLQYHAYRAADHGPESWQSAGHSRPSPSSHHIITGGLALSAITASAIITDVGDASTDVGDAGDVDDVGNDDFAKCPSVTEGRSPEPRSGSCGETQEV